MAFISRSACLRTQLLDLAAVMVVAGCTRSSSHDTARVRSDVESAFAITSPEGGTVWTEGQSYTIRWHAPAGAAVNIGAAVGGKDRGHLAFNLAAGTDSLRWTVPPGFVSGFGPQRSDAVHLRIEDAHDPMRFAESAMFTIKAAGVR